MTVCWQDVIEIVVYSEDAEGQEKFAECAGVLNAWQETAEGQEVLSAIAGRLAEGHKLDLHIDHPLYTTTFTVADDFLTVHISTLNEHDGAEEGYFDYNSQQYVTYTLDELIIHELTHSSRLMDADDMETEEQSIVEDTDEYFESHCESPTRREEYENSFLDGQSWVYTSWEFPFIHQYTVDLVDSGMVCSSEATVEDLGGLSPTIGNPSVPLIPDLSGIKL